MRTIQSASSALISEMTLALLTVSLTGPTGRAPHLLAHSPALNRYKES